MSVPPRGYVPLFESVSLRVQLVVYSALRSVHVAKCVAACAEHAQTEEQAAQCRVMHCCIVLRCVLPAFVFDIDI